jgi:SAM-dependent methyltransferase
MTDEEAVLARFDAGEISPEITLAQLLLQGRVPEAERLPAPVADLARTHADRLDGLAALARAGFDPTDHDPLASTAALFDRLAVTAPEAGVAFYSFGDPATLARATAELVAVIGKWAPLDGATVVDWGCGIGRMTAALAPQAAQVIGVDLSAGMISEAQRRCAAIPNTRFAVSGNGPIEEPDRSVDIVLVNDVLPFVVRAGTEAMNRHFAEFARLLRSGGRLLVFNWSYRGDGGADRADAHRLAAAHGFTVEREGERPFAIWDGTGFLLRRR